MFIERKLIVLSILMIAAPVGSYAAGFEIGLYGGAGKASMVSYNNSINSANASNAALGINSSLKQQSLEIQPELTVGYNFGVLSLYLKNSGIMLMDLDSKAVWPDGTKAESIRGDFSSVYSGFGVAYNIEDDQNHGLSGFAGIDAGVCYYYWNYMNEETYKADGENIYKIRKEWLTAIPAINVETGIKWLFAEDTGAAIKCGYRLASGQILVKVKNISGWTGAGQGEDNVDYSGFYAQAGIVYTFGKDAKPKQEEIKEIKSGSFPELAAKLVNEAQEFYDEGIYRQADRKIEEAMTMAPNDAQVKALYDKISDKLAEEKEADSIKRLSEEADKYRIKKQYAKARLRYEEILSIDASSPNALLFLKMFEAKADEALKEAETSIAKSDNENGFKKAKEALEYRPSDKRAAEICNLAKSGADKKEEAKKAYNEGVDYYRKGDFEKAAASWKRVVELDPDDKEAKKNMQKALDKAGASEEKIKAQIAKALEEAKSLKAEGNLDEASKKCGLVLRLDPENKDAAELEDEIIALQKSGNEDLINKR